VSWNIGDWCEVDVEKLGVDSRDDVRDTEKKNPAIRREHGVVSSRVWGLSLPQTLDHGQYFAIILFKLHEIW